MTRRFPRTLSFCYGHTAPIYMRVYSYYYYYIAVCHNNAVVRTVHLNYPNIKCITHTTPSRVVWWFNIYLLFTSSSAFLNPTSCYTAFKVCQKSRPLYWNNVGARNSNNIPGSKFRWHHGPLYRDHYLYLAACCGPEVSRSAQAACSQLQKRKARTKSSRQYYSHFHQILEVPALYRTATEMFIINNHHGSSKVRECLDWCGMPFFYSPSTRYVLSHVIYTEIAQRQPSTWSQPYTSIRLRSRSPAMKTPPNLWRRYQKKIWIQSKMFGS